MKNKNWLVVVLIFIMLSGIVASTLSSIHIIDKISSENSEQTTHILSARVHDSILNEMIRPIVVSETMAKDEGLIKLMRAAQNSKPETLQKELGEYLDAIYSGFGYQMVYAVCDRTKAYYTYKGLSKIIDPSTKFEDIWYKRFLESGKDYELDVDRDVVNNWDLSVFVNVRIEDKDGSFLGICGVAVEMTELQELLRKYEDTYQIKINLINESRLVQIDTDVQKIENSYVYEGNLSTQKPDQFLLEKKGEINVVSTYMPDLDWFLVVQDQGSHFYQLNEIIMPSIMILFVGLAAMVSTFGIVYYRGKNMQGTLVKKVQIEKKQMDILMAMSGIYMTTHVINLKSDTVEELCTAEHVRTKVNTYHHAKEQMVEAMKYTVAEEYVNAALTFTDLTTIPVRMKHSKLIMEQFVGKFNGWFRAQFIANTFDKDGNLETVIFTTQVIDDEKKQEENLVRISLTDELTGLYNRRAYEQRLEELEQEMPEDLVVVIMDFNGLKEANDTLGHEAGDELIRAAGKYMMETYVDRGQVFRTGGDEFIAIVQMPAEEIGEVVDGFTKKVSEWHGELNREMSIACGVVAHVEYPELGISDLIVLADKCMYADKSEYYTRSGKRRRE